MGDVAPLALHRSRPSSTLTEGGGHGPRVLASQTIMHAGAVGRKHETDCEETHDCYER
jgi:hypothetical protein